MSDLDSEKAGPQIVPDTMGGSDDARPTERSPKRADADPDADDNRNDTFSGDDDIRSGHEPTDG